MILSRISVPEDASGRWPFSLPVVQALRGDGLRLRKPVTFLVGENGAGKSTLIEAIAEAYSLDVRGGHGGRRYNNAPPKGPLGQAIKLEVRAPAGKRKGFFLRGETAMNVFEYMSDQGVAGYGDDRLLSEVSHGESILEVLRGRFQGPDLYLLDEPESGLSFTSILALRHVISEVADNGGQVVCATHSPLLSAIEGSSILEISGAGVLEVSWDDLDMTINWRRFLRDPSLYPAKLD